MSAHPFDAWFERNYKPLPGVPEEYQKALREAARSAFAECWNSALDESAKRIEGFQVLGVRDALQPLKVQL